ncbi:LuxR C-terminal-related transcriptional regulator [Streptomyces sp. NPDC015171]|uniref:LuxR C-terminal-related transcriptional regulator n=1 Tax=Streptomyces sp. NPDC015171 TaxID=3364945 RepID=UPI0037015BA6
MSDALYLIGSFHSAHLSEDARVKLDQARISFVRGNLRGALEFLDEALGGMDPDLSVQRDIVAFRVLTGSMVGENIEEWTPPGTEDRRYPDPLEVVSLCVRSQQKWHQGDLTEGLWLNQSAMHKSHGVIAMWKLYTELLLAKKLIDLHVSQQAVRIIQDMRGTIDGGGLLAFNSLPDALLATLDLQEGRFGDAIDRAAVAVALSDQQRSAVSVKLALSVAGMAHLLRGEPELAARELSEFHRRTDYYAYPDSVARAAFIEIALAAAEDGPGRAVELMHTHWPLLATASGCLVEDPARAAWMVATARAAGDEVLADRALRAVEYLARNNPGVPILESAAEYARSAAPGRRPDVVTALDFGGTGAPARPGGAGERGPFAPPEPAGHRPGGPLATPTGETGPRRAPSPSRSADDTTEDPHERLASLTQRELEIARHVARGLTNQQIARELRLSPHTVNYHLRNIFRKLAITSRVKLSTILSGLEPHDDSRAPDA